MKISSKTFYVDIQLNQIAYLFMVKLVAAAQRFIDVFRLLPIRMIRLSNHLLKGFLYFKPRKLHWWQREINPRFLYTFTNWLLEFIIYFLEVFGIGELYETLCDFVKFNTRPLYDWEIDLAKTIYGDSINYKRVRIDEYAFLGPKQNKFCYVGFYTINSWGRMQNSLLIHELIHIWQYENLGAVYMPRAVKAQSSTMGYNYGGISGLKAVLAKEKDIHAFNLEQQGDIVSDYYRIREGYRPRWGTGKREDLCYYETFIQDIKKQQA